MRRYSQINTNEETRFDMQQIARAVDEETVTRDLVPAFVKLLKDTEAEVRTAIAGQIPGQIRFMHHGAFLLIDSRVLWATRS